MRAWFTTFLVLAVVTLSAGAGEDIYDKVEDHFADSDGTKIHYVTMGEGPAILFVHGFPDFWYTWRHQMAGLADDYRVAAMDMRGYNKSDKPEGVDNYKMEFLLADVAAVIKDMGVDKVILVGHDWGGAICWRFAMSHAAMVDKLIILNLTHPKGYANVIANATDAQRTNTNYARGFATSKPGGGQTAEQYARVGAGQGDAVLAHYTEAMKNSDYDAMINYYRANYGGVADGGGEMPNIDCPVLQFHGLKDTAVDKDGLRDTWNWIAQDYTLVLRPA